MTARPKLVAALTVAWLIVGALLLLQNVPALIDSLRSGVPAGLMGIIRTAPDYLAASVAAIGALLGVVGLAAAVGLHRGSRAGRGVAEAATWALLLWLFVSALLTYEARASEGFQLLYLVVATLQAIPVIAVLLGLRSKTVQRYTSPA